MHVPALSTALSQKGSGTSTGQFSPQWSLLLWLASLSHSHGPAIPGLCPTPVLAGPDPDLLICIDSLILDLSPNHGLPWWPGLWADPGCHPQGCCLTACTVPKLNHQDKGHYFRATDSPRGSSGQSQLAQDGAPLPWRGGMMVSP